MKKVVVSMVMAAVVASCELLDEPSTTCHPASDFACTGLTGQNVIAYACGEADNPADDDPWLTCTSRSVETGRSTWCCMEYDNRCQLDPYSSACTQGVPVTCTSGGVPSDPTLQCGGSPAKSEGGSSTYCCTSKTADGGADADASKFGNACEPWWSGTELHDYGTVPAPDGNYYLTTFGCSYDELGGLLKDPGDNCHPSMCFDLMKLAGWCGEENRTSKASIDELGPECERYTTWFTADVGRFGCLARLKITNPKNKRAVVAIAIDNGPSCIDVEMPAKFPALDASMRISQYLFDKNQVGYSTKALVHVERVDIETPLGPVK